MPVTTSEWIDHIDALRRDLGEAQLLARLEAEGVGRDRAQWLIAVAARERNGRRLRRAGGILFAIAFIWIAVFWIEGARLSHLQILPWLATGVTAMVIATCGFLPELTRPLDLLANPIVPPDFPPPPRAIRGGTRIDRLLAAHWPLIGGAIVLISAGDLSRQHRFIATPRARFYLIGLAIVIPLFLFFLRRAMAGRNRLIERGVLALGEVVSIDRFTLTYTFEHGERKAYIGGRKLRERPAAGQPLAVLYDPANPRDAMPLATFDDIRFR